MEPLTQTGKKENTKNENKKTEPKTKKEGPNFRVLTNAVDGEVVTRFPPEPSGYLHIGHIKAAMLNYHYAKEYKGKMILRFDDTNPAKESLEFEQSIKDDLQALEIFPDRITYTSDYFSLINSQMEKLISEGNAFCDNTTQEEVLI